MNPFACVLIAEELEQLEVDEAICYVRGKRGPVKIVANKLSTEEERELKDQIIGNL